MALPKIYQMHRTKARQIGDDFNLIRAFEPMPGRIFSVRYQRRRHAHRRRQLE